MDIAKILPLYIGCKIKTHPDFEPNRREETEVKGICILTPDLLADLLNGTFPGAIGVTWKPYLRRLESMTAEEREIFGWQDDGEFQELYVDGQVSKNKYHAWQLPELLQLRIDLFGLIDSGQAIDAATLSPLNNESNG